MTVDAFGSGCPPRAAAAHEVLVRDRIPFDGGVVRSVDAASARADRWWTVFRSRPGATLTLVCFPYAGGTATVFKPWDDFLPLSVELRAIELPGRGRRAAEPLVTLWSELVPAVSEALSTSLDRPFVFFGHSLGALLGFEVVRWLRNHRGIAPTQFLASGRRAPHLPGVGPPSWNTSADELWARVRALNGTPPEVLEDPELRGLFLPRLRADFTLADTYSYAPGIPLECPIVALGGHDDEETRGDRMEAWRDHTSSAFTMHLFDGDHFFVHSCRHQLLAVIRQCLESSLSRGQERRWTRGSADHAASPCNSRT